MAVAASSMAFISIREAAAILGCLPRVISDAKYSGQLDEALFARVGRTTLIPRDSLSEIRRALVELGKLPGEA